MRMARLAAGLAALMIVGGITVAMAADRITTEETIVLHEHTVRNAFQDLNPESPVGDTFQFRSRLERGNGEFAGHLWVSCTIQFHHMDQCEHAVRFADGSEIQAQGLVPESQLKVGGSWSFAVVGGTERYEGVTGQLDIEIVNEAFDSVQVLHLLPA